MANARLKQARRRGSFRRSDAAQSTAQTPPQTPPASLPVQNAVLSQEEHLTAAQRDHEALQVALSERKEALETQLQSLTLGKPLTRDPEPGCDPAGRRLVRVHRDFLLQEMEWMAADFAQERKWRVRNAKMLSQALVSHLDRQEARLARMKKSEEVARRRAAARVGRDVKKFWSKIDKIIAFKVKLQADEMKQRHMQKHLTQLVEQTEKYSSALAASFQETEVITQEEIREQEKGDDSDFEMGEEEVDDESTIEADERITTRAEVDEELVLLQEEGELTVQELRERYAAMEEESGQTAGDDGRNSSEDDDDFELTKEEADDETTIAAEEWRSGPVSRRQAAREIAALQEESELSIEELRARYTGAFDDEDGDDTMSGQHDIMVGEDDDNDDDDGEFVPSRREEEAEADDETTIEEEERQEGAVTPSKAADELRLLREEGDMSIEQLRARYSSALSDNDPNDHEDTNNNEVSEPTSRAARDAVETNRKRPYLSLDDRETSEMDEMSTPRASLTTDEVITTSIRRSGGYKRPYLMTSRLDLREYQEAGVNWLISMCERRINGILADEMGLGKTIQTISLLAHLACNQGLWGPHLIVVPTSCLVNWEMEFKRWCPAFKVLTYYGSAKRRKELRQGWSKQNAFQVCITSYQLVVQDAHCFKRKKWYYLILDEAHNIKNWKSLRWQTLLTFSSQRRLLLTGTPLQNNLLELWALMHFLMPHVFASRKEFSYWFQNPLALIVENGGETKEQLADGTVASSGGKDLVTQLHGIIRPFVLRRLKKDVAKQLPGKFEHVITCQLSKRQRFLYEDFISRSSTRRAMYGRGKGRGANFMSMMNVLMQLRKVCNHPDLFEPRPISSPLDMPSLHVHVPSRCGFLVDEIVNDQPRVALWMERNLPGLELSRNDKFTSKRRRQLFFYDVSAPLPGKAGAVLPQAHNGKKDLVRRIVELAARRRAYWEQKRTSVAELQELRVALYLDEPVFGDDLRRACTMPIFISPAMEVHKHRAQPYIDARHPTEALQVMVRDPDERIASLQHVVNKAICFVPKARAKPARVLYGGGGFASDKGNFVLSRKTQLQALESTLTHPVAQRVLSTYHDAYKRTQLFFPDKALVQFDCGKLQQLAVLLRTLKRGGHRCLIFTQMSSMLNILEVFLNLHGHTYFRLDGATKVDKRQMLMERFNRDEKIFCFILSTRSGGLGINLTGADAVIFYDSDWNPAMDAQAQDRAHRIGQTRDVHIYRLVSEHTVEENILRKAQQKRHLDFLVMSEGQFTTDFFSKASLRELMTGSAGEGEHEEIESETDREDEGEYTDEDMDGDTGEMSLDAVESAMAQLEDEEDVVAMKGARAEFMQEQQEFDEESGNGGHGASPRGKTGVSNSVGGVMSKPSTPSSVLSASTVTSDKDDDDDDILVDEDAAEDEVDPIPNKGHNRSESASPDGSDHDQSLKDDARQETTTPSRKRHCHSSKDRRKITKRAKRSDSYDPGGKHGDKIREKARDAAEEQKLQAWKASVSSLQGFEDSLNSVDRYALHFREDVDPLYAYTPAQQAAVLAGIESNPSAPTLLQDIERIDIEKQEEEARLIAEGELVVGRLEDNDDTSTEGMTQYYNQLYRRERAHVLFERRKRLLTGAAWTVMKCANTGKPFYFNADTREATWDRPAVWTSNEQIKNARERGFGGLPGVALLRVLSMLTPTPERYHSQMVCRSWHRAAQHNSLFVKVNASDFDASSSTSLAQVLSRVASGDTVLFGAGVYQLEDVLEISKPVRLLAMPDSHVELQMHSGRAQLRWSARGGVICGFHITRTSSAIDLSVPVATANCEAKNTVKSSRKKKRSVLEKEYALGNWQHLLSVVGDGRLRVEYCELDGNGLGNACICVWGRGEKKRKHKRIESEDTKAIATTAVPGATTTKAGAPFPPSAVKTAASTTGKIVKTTSPVAAVAVKPVASIAAAAVIPAAPATTSVVKVTASTVAVVGKPAVTATAVKAVTPTPTPVSVSGLKAPTPSILAGEKRVNPLTPVPAPASTAPASISSNTLLVLQNCRIRSAGSSGVLLVRGALVMSLNTVEGNAHSGVTILGGCAVLRRNKIQRNSRFGLRLLYHAGHVVVEENVVVGNACGNLDVDNSGRRFVVRWNEMEKGNVSSDSLPHSHGRLRLKTFRVVEKEVPRAVATPSVAISVPSVYYKNYPVTSGVASSVAKSSMAAIPSARPTVASTNTSINMMAAAMGLMRSSAFPQLSRTGLPHMATPLHVAHLPMAFASLGATKPTISSMGVGRPTTSVQSPATNAYLYAASRATAVKSGGPGTTTTVGSSTATSIPISEPAKKRRKRRLKTHQVVMDGREIVLRDTCEKRSEKVVKPRRPKDPLAAVAAPNTPMGQPMQRPVVKLPAASGTIAVTATLRPANNHTAPSTTVQVQRGATSQVVATAPRLANSQSARPTTVQVQQGAVSHSIVKTPPVEPERHLSALLKERGEKRKLDATVIDTKVPGLDEQKSGEDHTEKPAVNSQAGAN